MLSNVKQKIKNSFDFVHVIVIKNAMRLFMVLLQTDPYI